MGIIELKEFAKKATQVVEEVTAIATADRLKE